MRRVTLLALVPLLALACVYSSAAQLPDLPAIPSIPPSPTVTPGLSFCRVTADESLNLRKGPGIEFPVLAWLAPGDLLTILSDPAAGDWIHVQAGDLRGWINSKYCKGQ